MRWRIDSVFAIVRVGWLLRSPCGEEMAAGLHHDQTSSSAGRSGALDGWPDRPLFAADPTAGSGSGRRRRAGSRPAHGHRGPAGDGAGTGAELHHLPSGAQPQPLVQCCSCPAPARAAGAGLRAERADRRWSRRHSGAPPGGQERSQRDRSRSGALVAGALRQSFRSALAQPDAAGPGALGRTGLGAAGPDGARPLGALPSAAQPAPQDPARLGGRQMLLRLRRWLPERRLVAVTDSSFAALDLLAAVRRYVCVVTRLRLDANLFAPAPLRQPGQVGRPRRKGKRLAKLAQRLAQQETPWQQVTVPDWYGEHERSVEILSGTAVWYHAGLPVVPIRWVLVRDPAGQFAPQAFLCTDLEADPVQILTWFVLRWRLEVTFEEARAHLGLETQRQWSDKAIARTTPALLGLVSLITLWADDLVAQTALRPRQASWCAKPNLTFSDAIAAVRYHLWLPEDFATSPELNSVLEIPRTLFERLTATLCYAG